MANHGYVKTKKPMTGGAISAIIAQINRRYLMGNLAVESNEGGWGKYTWLLTYKSSINGQEYASRVCWLNNSKSFEIRYGGGGDFAWWIDHLMRNRVALAFDGKITDDGDNSVDKGSRKRSKLSGYIKTMWPGQKGHRSQMLNYAITNFIPPEMIEKVKAELGI